MFIFLTAVLFCSCGGPKNFTYRYRNENTGLEKLIDINGYYVSQHACDLSFYSVYMFYPGGLFTIATTSELLPDLVDCFGGGGKSAVCSYPLWGTYKVEGELIRTQTIRMEGNGCVIFRDYRILPDKKLINISDYVQPEYTNLGYMENYPSFKENSCGKTARFYPLETKRNIADCPLLNKKWFKNK